MKRLSLEGTRHLQATKDWLGLCDCVSASNEIQEMTAQERANPAVLSLGYVIYSKAGRWDMAAEAAEGLAAMLSGQHERDNLEN